MRWCSAASLPRVLSSRDVGANAAAAQAHDEADDDGQEDEGRGDRAEHAHGAERAATPEGIARGRVDA